MLFLTTSQFLSLIDVCITRIMALIDFAETSPVFGINFWRLDEKYSTPYSRFCHDLENRLLTGSSFYAREKIGAANSLVLSSRICRASSSDFEAKFFKLLRLFSKSESLTELKSITFEFAIADGI